MRTLITSLLLCSSFICYSTYAENYEAPAGAPTANVRVSGYQPGHPANLRAFIFEPPACDAGKQIPLAKYFDGSIFYRKTREKATADFISEALALHMPLAPDLKFPDMDRVKELKVEANKPIYFKFEYWNDDAHMEGMRNCNVGATLVAEENANYEVSLVIKTRSLKDLTLDHCEVRIYKIVEAEKDNYKRESYTPSEANSCGDK